MKKCNINRIIKELEKKEEILVSEIQIGKTNEYIKIYLTRYDSFGFIMPDGNIGGEFKTYEKVVENAKAHISNIKLRKAKFTCEDKEWWNHFASSLKEFENENEYLGIDKPLKEMIE